MLDKLEKAKVLVTQMRELLSDNESAMYVDSYLNAVDVEVTRQINNIKDYMSAKEKVDSGETYNLGLYGKPSPIGGKVSAISEDEASRTMQQIQEEKILKPLNEAKEGQLSDSLDDIADYKLDFPEAKCLDCDDNW